MITYAEAKAYMGLPNDDDQTLVETLIGFSESTIETELDQKIDQATLTGEVLRINESGFDLQQSRGLDLAGRYITSNLKYYPVISATISLDGVDMTDGTEYVLDNDTGRIEFLRGVGDDRHRLLATYEAGYDPVPADLKYVALELTKYLYQDHGATKGEGDIKSKKLDSFSVTYNAKSTAVSGFTGMKVYTKINEFDHILNKYRRVEI